MIPFGSIEERDRGELLDGAGPLERPRALAGTRALETAGQSFFWLVEIDGTFI